MPHIYQHYLCLSRVYVIPIRSSLSLYTLSAVTPLSSFLTLLFNPTIFVYH